MPLDRILRNLITWQRADGPPVPAREMTVEDARERYRANSVRPRQAVRTPVTAVDRMIGSAFGAGYTPRSPTRAG